MKWFLFSCVKTFRKSSHLTTPRSGSDLQRVNSFHPGLDLGGPLLLRNLDELLPGLEVLLGADLFVLACSFHVSILALLFLFGGSRGRRGLFALRFEHDHRGGAFRAGGDAEVGAGPDVEVGDAVLLAENREVEDHVHGGDVARDDDQTGDVG